MKHSRLLLTLSAVLAAACGDDASSDGDGGPAGPDASSDPAVAAGTAMAAAYCEKVFQCCDAAEQAEELGFFDPDPTTPDECTGYLAYFSISLVQDLILADTEGRIDLDLSQVEDCAAAIVAAPCSGWDVEDDPFIAMVDDPACAAIVVAMQDEGATCGSDPECLDGDCGITTQVCSPERGSGETCQSPTDCADGLGCADNVCVDLAPIGGTCSYDNECASDHCDYVQGGSELGACYLKCDGA